MYFLRKKQQKELFLLVKLTEESVIRKIRITQNAKFLLNGIDLKQSEKNFTYHYKD